ncbi:hypothetical protein CYMTET_7564 [Cymbomonas tetramitiformis]|uniref:Uncharacterized protein n=1 Tax=Cymbomonas tetramitiformis TaxID=36881 RepID=A0AAE0GUR8_9CHLO|nr:hypothetical protein CYMTET_7564 [Cymbomonas tetramitiformis]
MKSAALAEMGTGRGAGRGAGRGWRKEEQSPAGSKGKVDLPRSQDALASRTTPTVRPRLTEPDNWCFSFDLQDDYHAVGIDPDFQRYM